MIYHKRMRDGPKYVVQFQWEIDSEQVSPLQAGVEALRVMRSDGAYVDVIDCDTGQRWDVRFRDHKLEIIPIRRVVVAEHGR